MIAVVGAGPSGLAAAHRLRAAGQPVRVLEASERAGGKLRTAKRDGFVVDQGAFFLPTTHRALLALAEETGFADRIVPGGFVLATARDGALHELDGERALRDLASTRLLSRRAKLRLARLVPEVARARRATFERMPETGAYDTESVDAWARRTLGDELAEYITGATMRAIFATSERTASRVDFLAVIALFKGARLVAFREGMGSFADHLASQLDIETGARVGGVEEVGNEVHVSWTDAEGAERSERFAGCVLAVPAVTAVRLHRGLDPWRADVMRRVRNGRLVCLSVALARAPAGVRATYIQVPRSVQPFLGGVALDHNKAPGRVPPGKGLLTLAALNDWSELHADDGDDELAAQLLEALEVVLPGAAADVEQVEVNRWTQEYSPVGHYRDLGRFRRECEARDRLVQLAGDYHSAQNLDSATHAGQRAAARLLDCLATSGTFPRSSLPDIPRGNGSSDWNTVRGTL